MPLRKYEYFESFETFSHFLRENLCWRGIVWGLLGLFWTKRDRLLKCLPMMLQMMNDQEMKNEVQMDKLESLELSSPTCFLKWGSISKNLKFFSKMVVRRCFKWECTPGLNQPYKAFRSSFKLLTELLGSPLNDLTREATSDLSIGLCRGWIWGHVIYPNV